MITFEAIEAKWAGRGNITVVAARAKIPGAWLVAAQGAMTTVVGTVCFVPDPNHEWDGSSLPADQEAA